MRSQVRFRASVWAVVALGSALVAAACSSGAPEPRATASPSPLPSPSVITTGAPEVFDATQLETEFPIKHVVFLIKENRTFDNLFGTFPGANGVTVGMEHGAPRELTPGTDGRIPGDIPHCYTLRARRLERRRHGRLRPGGAG